MTILKQMAQLFVERAKTLGYKRILANRKGKED